MNTELRQGLVNRARDWVVAQHAPERFARQLMALCDEVASKPDGTRMFASN
jgi:hypothetical protein